MSAPVGATQRCARPLLPTSSPAFTLRISHGCRQATTLVNAECEESSPECGSQLPTLCCDDKLLLAGCGELLEVRFAPPGTAAANSSRTASKSSTICCHPDFSEALPSSEPCHTRAESPAQHSHWRLQLLLVGDRRWEQLMAAAAAAGGSSSELIAAALLCASGSNGAEGCLQLSSSSTGFQAHGRALLTPPLPALQACTIPLAGISISSTAAFSSCLSVRLVAMAVDADSGGLLPWVLPAASSVIQVVHSHSSIQLGAAGMRSWLLQHSVLAKRRRPAALPLHPSHGAPAAAATTCGGQVQGQPQAAGGAAGTCWLRAYLAPNGTALLYQAHDSCFDLRQPDGLMLVCMRPQGVEVAAVTALPQGATVTAAGQQQAQQGEEQWQEQGEVWSETWWQQDYGNLVLQAAENWGRPRHPGWGVLTLKGGRRFQSVAELQAAVIAAAAPHQADGSAPLAPTTTNLPQPAHSGTASSGGLARGSASGQLEQGLPASGASSRCSSCWLGAAAGPRAAWGMPAASAGPIMFGLQGELEDGEEEEVNSYPPKRPRRQVDASQGLQPLLHALKMGAAPATPGFAASTPKQSALQDQGLSAGLAGLPQFSAAELQLLAEVLQCG